jgi:hypothetical protein
MATIAFIVCKACVAAISFSYEVFVLTFPALWSAVLVRMSLRFLGLEIATCILS